MLVKSTSKKRCFNYIFINNDTGKGEKMDYARKVVFQDVVRKKWVKNVDVFILYVITLNNMHAISNDLQRLKEE